MKTHVFALAGAVVLFVTCHSGADEPARHPVLTGVVAAPAPPLPQPAVACDREHQFSKVEHLRRAADHLEAAGADDLARQIREEAEAILAGSVDRLEELRAEMSRLQQEIAELEDITGSHQQVMLRCRVVDVDIAKVRQLGCSFSSMTDHDVIESADSSPFQFGPNDPAIMEGFIDALVREDLARVLAEPVLVTTNGRPANLHSGGEFPILLPNGPDETTIEYRKFGLTLEAVPVVLGDGRVRLDMAPELATPDFENAVTVNDTVIPGLTVRRLNTQVEMEFGETVTLVMPAPGEVESVRQTSAGDGDGKDKPTVTIFCVTPERVRPMHQHPVPQPQPASAHLQVLPTY